jgi:Cu-Zn family superoxide dismutase
MIRVLAPIAAAVLLSACAAGPSGPSASAQLQPTRGNTTSGEVKFTQQGDKVLVTGEIRGLRSNGEHVLHIHDKVTLIRLAKPTVRMTVVNTTLVTCPA